MLERNRESFQNLIENLIENGYDPAKIPIVIQLNKRDLPNVASVGDLVAVMGVEGYPVCEAVASRGDGVFETLKMIVKLTLSRLRSQFEAGGAVGGAERRETPSPSPPPPPPSMVFAPAPAPPPPSDGVAAPPVPVAPVPQSLEVEIEVPAIPSDGIDEFDLEYFSDEKAEPVAAVGPEVALGEEFPEEDVVDLEADMESLMDGQRGAEEEVPDTAGPTDVDDIAEARVESAMAVEDEWPVETSPFDAVTPPAEPFTHAPPPWAVEMMEELQRLRAENSVLRDALRGITTLLDRQIGVLQGGREELERHVGEIPGESVS